MAVPQLALELEDREAHARRGGPGQRLGLLQRQRLFERQFRKRVGPDGDRGARLPI